MPFFIALNDQKKNLSAYKISILNSIYNSLTLASVSLHSTLLILRKNNNMPIITAQEIVSSLKMEKYGQWGVKLSHQFMNWFRIKHINQLYDLYHHLDGLEFIDAVLEHLDISIVITDNDIKRIPKKGPFIMIANHPLGAIDGLIMLKILLTYHAQSKVMANFILKRIKPIANQICAVNPFESDKESYSSIAGIRQALSQLQQGYPLGIFPAGEVSTRTQKFIGPINDKAWDISALKLIQKAKVPVLPVYFHAKNSDIFYWMADFHNNLRTVTLPSEVLKSKGKQITVRIGNIVCVETQSQFNNINQFGEMLRTKTYQLRNAYIKPKTINIGPYLLRKKISDVLPFQSLTELQSSFENLSSTDALLFTKGDYQVYFTKLSDFPAIQTEIGRLREITFRSIGEGTDKAIDIDDYDTYYHHLILWNHKEKEIVGAYRMALGADVYKKFGLKGFYISELFHLTGSMHELMSQSIEMGRAFIIKSYQQKPLPLFILWKGIICITQRFPAYKYLIGAASISSIYCPYSRSLIVEYLKLHHTDKLSSLDVAPKLSFKSVLKGKDKILISNGDIKNIDHLIEEIEPHGLKIPILIKKYLLHNAKMLGFNVDAKFNMSIDALLYITIDDIDKSKFL